MLLKLGDLAELELDRGLATEDVDQHLELELVLVDLCDLAREVGERAFLDPDRLADLVLEARTGRLVPWHSLIPDLEKCLDLGPRQRSRLRPRPDKAGHARRHADHRPRVIVELAAA